MPILPLQDRHVVEELMDAPGLDAPAHHQALAGLARINRASGAARRIAKPILHLAQTHRLQHLRILDVACGGGDVPVAVASLLQNAGLQVHLSLIDRSETAIAEAKQHLQQNNLTATFYVGEVPQNLPPKTATETHDFDIVTNSLFLHHLTEDQVVASLAAMRERAGRLLVVSDLRRSFWGWIAAWVGCRFLSRSKIVHFDGPVSVAAAYTTGEMRKMAERAGMANAKIERIFPWRMLLTWERA